MRICLVTPSSDQGLYADGEKTFQINRLPNGDEDGAHDRIRLPRNCEKEM